MTVDPGQMVPQEPRDGMTAESIASWQPYLKKRPAVVAPVETPVSVPGDERYGHGSPEPLLCVGDLVDQGMRTMVVVRGPDGELRLDGPVNRRADCGGLW